MRKRIYKPTNCHGAHYCPLDFEDYLRFFFLFVFF